MTDLLREAFQDLADETPSLALPAQAWRDGRRSRRRWQVAGAAVAAAAVLSTGFVGWGVARPASTPDLAAPTTYADADLQIPDQLWRPSGWLDGTDTAGPLGPLAVLGTVPDRHTSWTNSGPAIYGVSALTGEYRYLDLPDASTDPNAVTALSPDGTTVAYWYTGTPTGEVISDVIGVALYDTSTGGVSRYPMDPRHGLDTASIVGPIWARDASAVRTSATVTGSGVPAFFARERVSYVNLVTGRSTLTTSRIQFGGDSPILVPAFRVRTGSSWTYFDGAPTSFSRKQLAVTPDGSTVALKEQGPDAEGGQTERLFVAPMPGQTGISDATMVTPLVELGSVIGWSDDSHVVVLSPDTTSRGDQQDCLCSVDVSTGQRESFVALNDTFEPMQLQVASSMLANPRSTAAVPPHPIDPRLLAAGGVVALVLVVGWLSVWLWTRRRRLSEDEFAELVG